MHLPRGFPFLLAVLLATLGGCDGGGERQPAEPGATTRVSGNPPAGDSALDQHFHALLAGRSERLLQDAAQGTRTFCETLKVFLNTTNDTNLILTRTSWIVAHAKYQAAEIHNLLYGVTLDESVDAWPALGGYIDRAPGYPHSGIVNDTTIDIDGKSLRAQHQLTDASEVSVGFHALEYLLWGDPDDTPRNADFFRKPKTDEGLEAQAALRRRDYLATACKLLSGHLAVQAGAETPRSQQPAKLILTRAGKLLETRLAAHVDAVSRLGTAEDECAFSQQALCGVLPAVRELLELAEDEQLRSALLTTAPELSGALQNSALTVRGQLEELEDAADWDAGRGAAFADSLRELGRQLKEAATTLPGG